MSPISHQLRGHVMHGKIGGFGTVLRAQLIWPSTAVEGSNEESGNTTVLSLCRFGGYRPATALPWLGLVALNRVRPRVERVLALLACQQWPPRRIGQCAVFNPDGLNRISLKICENSFKLLLYGQFLLFFIVVQSLYSLLPLGRELVFRDLSKLYFLKRPVTHIFNYIIL